MKYVVPVACFALTGLSVLLSAWLLLSAPAVEPEAPVLPDIMAASVLVGHDEGRGSGVAFHNGPHTFVWTDAHVVAGALVDGVAAPPPAVRPQRFRAVWVAQGGPRGAMTTRPARIVRYSVRHDVALLKMDNGGWPAASVRFAPRQDVPRPGEPLWHVSCPSGERGLGSVSDGVFACSARLRFNARPDPDGVEYDQVSLNSCHRGSSGGGVFRKSTGECLGLVTEFLGPGFTFGAMCMTPSRRLWDFAGDHGCLWAMDAAVPVPEKDRVSPLCDEVSLTK